MSTAPQWHQVELELHLALEVANPYVEVAVEAEFRHATGERLVRPAFFDGDDTWRVRFASPHATGSWTWVARAAVAGQERVLGSGTLTATPPPAHRHPALRHGFLRVAPGGRALAHADGSSAFLVADTPWALPWRATVADVEHYARDRAQKGFNAALLMTVQPDMRAAGPDARGVDHGFARGFSDLPTGRLTEIVVPYFRYLDQIVTVLVDHGITPVLQPVFQGFGWKGLDVAGTVVPPEDYARYCRYLVARYGAGPAIYLVGADGRGTEPQVEAGGREVERWDCYGQPTGLHYRPHARNAAHQSATWLDFQWCQTGHEGEHVPERVADMWRNTPVRPVMNGEPTYENSGRRGKAAGWWQGHEAWSNLCAGATMGVAYGAGSLWQWRISATEPGHEPFFLAPDAGWREALEFEGSRYVGLVGRILSGLPTSDLVPCWDVGLSTRGLIDPGVLYLAYAEHGGRFVFLDADGRVPSRYWLLDPRSGQVVGSGTRPANGGVVDDPGGAPRVLVCYDGDPAGCPGLSAGATR
jgi:hypothetical protein